MRVVFNGNIATFNGSNTTTDFAPDPSKFLESKDDRVIVLAQPGEHALDTEIRGNVTIVVIGQNAPTQVSLKGDVGGSIHASQGQISVGGSVRGDVHASQGNIQVGGAVGGDVHSSMGSISIKGNVSGSARTSMGDVRVSGKM